MNDSSPKPVDIWKRLKKLNRGRQEIVERMRRVNESIAVRAKKLNKIGEKHGQLTFAIDRLRDELSEEQKKEMFKLLEVLSKQVDKLTHDIAELSEPSILLFAEFEDVEAEIKALHSIINAEKPGKEIGSEEEEVDTRVNPETSDA